MPNHTTKNTNNIEKEESKEQPVVSSSPPTTKLRVGISIGDINGISIEVIIKTLRDSRIIDHFIPIVYGSSKVISYHRKVLKAEDFTYNIISNVDRAKPSTCNILNCWTEEIPITIGRPNRQAGAYALRAIEAAAHDLARGKIDLMVTAPVNKSVINVEDMPFTGHTEYLTDFFDVKESLMLMLSDQLKVGLVTNHLAIKDIASNLSQALIEEKIRIFYHSLISDFAINRPKLAVLALNPHAGDDGLLGSEEKDMIIPAIENAKKDNMLVFGPYAADGFFGNGLQAQFDGILAMFHDQGLVPFKALSFGTGVNFTAGLPIIRTSPDHGTAYDIAGKNIASPDSFRKALFTAIDLYKNREIYKEISKNPLQKGRIKIIQKDENPANLPEEPVE